MGRYSKVSTERGKGRPRKSLARKTRPGVRSPGGRDSRAADHPVAALKRQLKDAAQQDKATSEVLRIISRSTGDLRPVFATILANAVQVCDANNGVINRWDGNALHLIATHKMPPEFTDLRTRSPYRPNQHSPSGRMLATRTFVHIRDLAKDQSYARRNPPTVAAVEIAGVRTTLAVPMFKENELVGSLTVGRTEVRPFTAKQIELVQNFAAKAVIAIENARLVHELQESLEQQTAVSDVLQVITGSPGNLQPVFDAVLENARRLCDAEFGNIYRWDGDALNLVAWRNTPPAFAEYRQRAPFRPSPTSLVGRMLKTKSVVHVADAAVNRDYSERTDPSLVAAIELGGVRTYVAVPMLKEGELIGAFTLFRQEVRPFTNRQIALITSFANQVSIAIENARLAHELRESLQQQAAAADVLKVMSRSTFDLQTVLDRLAELVTKLCDAELAAIHRQEGMKYRVIAICGGPPNFREIQDSVPLEPGRGTVIGRAVLERKPVHVADVLADPDYLLKEAQQKLGYRTVLGVPLMREGRPIGVIALLRLTVRPFTEKQIKLVQSFADQAVIAIENTRLLSELRQRTDELGRSVAELQRERNNKLMNLEAMVAAISHEVKQPLAGIAADGGAALRFLRHVPPNLKEARLGLENMIKGSLLAGQVFDNIRALFGKSTQNHLPVSVNELTLSVLQMLRDELKDHCIETHTAMSSELPLIAGHWGQLQEVFINLIRNAIEAMATVKGDRLLQVRAERYGSDAVVVMVEDSGPGIDPKQLDSIFDAFVTTKPDGMGLGLAICRTIIERHGGQLSALPAHSQGSIFRIVLPADHASGARSKGDSWARNRRSKASSL